MTPTDLIAVVLLGLALLALVSLPPVDRPVGWPTPKTITDRVTLWGLAVLIAIVLASIPSSGG